MNLAAGPSRGYMGLTDPDWYRHLSSIEQLDEVNFWQPHGGRTFKAIRPGDPFFFKLRAPLKSIAGFGYFQRFESMPAWLAWETFGQANGAATFRDLVERLAGLRGDDVVDVRTGDFMIGCIMLAAPMFFPEEIWVDPPSDWAKTGIQQGKGYGLEDGEGRRVFWECLERASASARPWNVDEIVRRPTTVGDAERFGPPIQVRPRRGQGVFSSMIRDAYGNACAVTNEHSLPTLEAAHIRPYSEGGQHDVGNGILLRRDIHRLFDLGYVTVTPDYRFRVGESLRNEYSNGRSYYPLSGRDIVVPAPEDARPSREALEWHGERVFRG